VRNAVWTTLVREGVDGGLGQDDVGVAGGERRFSVIDWENKKERVKNKRKLNITTQHVRRLHRARHCAE
jgi:hypothetical protein